MCTQISHAIKKGLRVTKQVPGGLMSGQMQTWSLDYTLIAEITTLEGSLEACEDRHHALLCLQHPSLDTRLTEVWRGRKE